MLKFCKAGDELFCSVLDDLVRVDELAVIVR